MTPPVRPLADADRDRAAAFLAARWGDATMVVHGEVVHPAAERGFVAGDWDGLVTYRVADDACEILSLDAVLEGAGIGSMLLDAVTTAARDAGCARVWLTTTNDNRHALDWYARRGFVRVAVREGAVDETRRRHKPSIPLVNETSGLPIHDEIDLSRPVSPTG